MRKGKIILFLILISTGCEKGNQTLTISLPPVDSPLVNENPGTGGPKSLIFDSSCNPHIFYQDGMAGVIMHAYPSEGRWKNENVSLFDANCVRGNAIKTIYFREIYVFSLDRCLDYDAITIYTMEKGEWKEKEIMYFLPQELLSFDVLLNGESFFIYSNSISFSKQEIKETEFRRTDLEKISTRSLYLSHQLETPPSDIYSYRHSLKSLNSDIKREIFFKDLYSDSLKHISISDESIQVERPQYYQVKGENLFFSSAPDGFVATLTGSYAEEPTLYRDGIPEERNTYSIINMNQVFIPSSNFSPGSSYKIDYETPITFPSSHGKYIDGAYDPYLNQIQVVYSDETSSFLTYISGNFQKWALLHIDKYYTKGYTPGPISLSMDYSGSFYIFYRDAENENLRMIVNPGDFYFKDYDIHSIGITGIEPSSSACKNHIGISAGVLKYFPEEKILDTILYFFIIF